MKHLSTFCLVAFVALSAPARAADGGPATIGEAIGKLFESANLRSTPPPAADFVVRSRPAELDYTPLAKPQTGPPGTRNASELQKLEKELGAAAAANRSRAARVRAPDGGAAKQRASVEARGRATRQRGMSVD